MQSANIEPPASIALFVKNILVFRDEENRKTNLNFFADGYPGLIFQQSKRLYVAPQNKEMPLFFLYGQTLHPVELIIEGCYSLVCFQFYPFVLKSFFNLNAKDLNDDCYNLDTLHRFNVSNTINALTSSKGTTEQQHIISRFLYNIFEEVSAMIDYKIQQSIQLIIHGNGGKSVSNLSRELNINERTFERRFIKQVGISPKQFSQIIKFQSSLNQLNEKDYNKLTDIVYGNGFADQSHFIRVFKAFTGKTPKQFKV